MIFAHHHHRRVACRPSGFTLVELLITVSIIAIMASMMLFALYGAQETARAQKTKALIAKLDAIIKTKYESYATRRIPIASTLPPNPTAAQVFAWRKLRLDALRELMRMELPERWTDIATVDPSTSRIKTTTSPNYGQAVPITPGLTPPSVAGNTVSTPPFGGYFGKVYTANQANPANPSLEFQSAECLYLIVMAAAAEDADDKDMFRPTDSADVDGDGFREFVDGWGQPIRFLRWAPGFVSELQAIARGKVASVNPSGQTVTITATGTNFSAASGAYVGGSFIVTDPITGQMKGNQMAKITAYSYSAPTATATFTCTTPSGTTTQSPFWGNSPAVQNSFVVTGPDPFDARGVYPIYPSGATFAAGTPDTSTPTFATYPLIYSSGPDKCYGVISDTDSSDPNNPLHFNAPDINLGATSGNKDVNRVNPFYRPSNGKLMGTIDDLTAEPNFVPSGWLDNIHNHMIGQK